MEGALPQAGTNLTDKSKMKLKDFKAQDIKQKVLLTKRCWLVLKEKITLPMVLGALEMDNLEECIFDGNPFLSIS